MSSLTHKLKVDHPQLVFFQTEHFSWSPSSKTISYNPDLPHAKELLLHEVSHARIGHDDYRRDIELIAMETAAWDEAKQLAAAYDVTIDEDIIQDNLDTYRDWLHARSTCPHCSATGYQTKKAAYACPACLENWTVNEARICALRRYKTQKNPQ